MSMKRKIFYWKHKAFKLFPVDSVKTDPQEEDCRTGFNRGNLMYFSFFYLLQIS
ncbi:hypothetical protein RLOC_00008395 [Lonchura striata]|uniref:Uncharacterized protein n=1 Tax=Lonchura striata TaxID=40157 RepID=A0A218UW40_9PASE|nr:hypothetical protein RLOC_00008395 [Lonchura striata domestica]